MRRGKKRDPVKMDGSVDRLEQTAKEVVIVAKQNKKTLATVESCTGGLIAHMITETPGASGVLEAGWVCYSNAAKIGALGLSKELFMEHGAVSEPVARELALAGREQAGVDFAVSTTGIAGPTGATPGKPVGLMWCAVAGEKTRTSKVLVEGLDRSATKRAFATHALERLLQELGR